MGSLSELWDERQIQILVLLSFVLQAFLFFAGSTRYRSRNAFLRVLLWLAYLGADAVAIYALGVLSRQQDAAPNGERLSEIHPLGFIWAPFLLIHLGGQDTITAFAIEDNNLWLRHLLNLVLQVGLALYVFWKPFVWHNVHLLLAGIFLFLAGILKYGERMMALKYGVLKCLMSEDMMIPHPELDQELLKAPIGDPSYAHVIAIALRSAGRDRNLFGRLTSTQQHLEDTGQFLCFESLQSKYGHLSLKALEVELRLIYDELYTKARVLRTRTGIIVRCISQVSIIIALVLFFTISDKESYSKTDIAITYPLFLGGICLEVCAALMMVMSVWTWGWLKLRNYHRFAHVSWWLLSSSIAFSEKRNLWSNSMGQYNFLSFVETYDSKSMGWKQIVMRVIRKSVWIFYAEAKTIVLWFSKLLETSEITVDYYKEIMGSISKEASSQHDFPCLSPTISKGPHGDIGETIIFYHVFTAIHLSKYVSANPAGSRTEAIDTTIEVCQKLSNYMFYLFVTHPEMLPTNANTEQTLEQSLSLFVGIEVYGSPPRRRTCSRDKLLEEVRSKFESEFPTAGIEPCEDSLEEIKRIWIRLLMYAAGKSRPDMHAALLARGGELLTIVWLHMLHNGMGDMGRRRFKFFGPNQDDGEV